MNNTEKRRSKRYEISEYIKEDLYEDLYIEIVNTNFKPEIIDISLSGLGFSIKESADPAKLGEFDKMFNYFINIHFLNKVILAEVKKIWSIIIEEAGNKILKGGVVFSVMSPEDRMYLAEFINTLVK